MEERRKLIFREVRLESWRKGRFRAGSPNHFFPSVPVMGGAKYPHYREGYLAGRGNVCLVWCKVFLSR